MLFSINLKYASTWGQQLYLTGNHEALGGFEELKAIPLQYINNEIWSIDINLDIPFGTIEYYYFLVNKDGTKAYSALQHKVEVNIEKYQKVNILDVWCSTNQSFTTFFTQPFETIFGNHTKVKLGKQSSEITHIIKVRAPQLQKNEALCIVGNSPKIGAWNTDNPKLLKLHNGYYQIELNLPKTENQLVYKYGIYNTTTKSFEKFEEGDNRVVIFERTSKEIFLITDAVPNIPFQAWKAAGVAIPVFSLRTKNSFGAGEFSDLKLLANWCNKVNLKVIQLLPINDTTVYKTNKDSYPYAANSSFALHPLYINLHEVGVLPMENKYETAYLRQQRKLNKLDHIDYEGTIKFKLAYLKELYLLDVNFLQSEAFQSFFNDNKDWLVAYAVYSFLRDKHKTTDFSKWGSYSTIDAKKMDKLTSKNAKQLKDIGFWYFVQFHLHCQLKSAVAYTHELGIALKGDIPIGIGRTSCDAWQYPNLFNMDKQAGAPPDDFAVKGQNWGFPTYNWKAMQENGFQWWKDRFSKMHDYFDAFRIDHILGFFRIWSIPQHAVEGIMGHFIPAIPIHINEFAEKGIYFDYQKFTIPHFTEGFLENTFGELSAQAKDTFFEQKDTHFVLKEEFNTQKKVESYFSENDQWDVSYKSILFDCVNNVLFFEEENSDGKNFHFNIAMEKTLCFSLLNSHQQHLLKSLYINYFYERQDDFWKTEANKKLPTLQKTTQMLICGEDLGMVPHCVPGVMSNLSILSLEVQRMPKASGASFVNLHHVPYLSVATPSTHDMSTIREWWEESRTNTQHFYNQSLGHYGEAPEYCEPWVVKDIINQHLYAPSMLSIFQLQDLLALSNTIRRENPVEERINVPANPNHYWCYRMHIKLENLIKEKDFNNELSTLIQNSGR